MSEISEAPAPPAPKRVSLAQRAKSAIANRLFGSDEGPQDTAKRALLKKAAVISGAIAYEAVTKTVQVKVGLAAKDTYDFVHDAPEIKGHPTATRIAQYDLEASPILTPQDAPKYKPYDYLVFGDSLAWGFVEKYDSNGVLIVDPNQGIQCNPSTVMCEEMNAAKPTSTEGVPIQFGAATFDSFPGATIDQIPGQILAFNQGLDQDPDAYAPIPFDAVLAVGGNNALNFLSGNISLDVIRNFKTKFIPEQFKPKMREIIETILRLRTEGNVSPLYKHMKHLIVSGVPDIGKSNYFYLPADEGKPSKAISLDIPGLRGIATAMCKYMNRAILDVIEEAQLAHPDIPILFEDIFDVPVHGIHPTEEGYKKIAKKREARSVAKFTEYPNRMTYSEFIERQKAA